MNKFVIRYFFRMAYKHIQRTINGQGNIYELRNDNGEWEKVSFWRFMDDTCKIVRGITK